MSFADINANKAFDIISKKELETLIKKNTKSIYHKSVLI